MLAAVRPDSWNFPLFLHVLGAMLLFGTTGTAAILAWTGVRIRETYLARAAFRTLLLGVLPAWFLMRAGAAWIESREDIQGDPGWLGVGFVVAEPGLLLMVAAAILAYVAVRKSRTWAITTVAVLSSVYVLALGIAWWAMSAKP